MDTNEKDFATANDMPLHSTRDAFEDDDRLSSFRDNHRRAVLRLRGMGLGNRSTDSAGLNTSSNVPKGNGEFESSCKNEMYDERLRGVRSFFRKHLENTSLTSEDIGKIICEEAKNFVEGRPIGSELDRLEGLEDDFHQSINRAYRIDAHLQRTYYNNADNLRILGCLRRLQDFEDAVGDDGSQAMLESAIGACASKGMDEYGHGMALQIGKKKKGKGIAAEDMLKTCLIGIERYETLIEKYDDKMNSLKIRFQDMQNTSAEEVSKLQQQFTSMAAAKNKIAKDKQLIQKNYKEIVREKERIIKDMENQRRLEIIEAQNHKEQFRKEKIDSTNKLNKAKRNLAKMSGEMEQSQNKVKSLEVKCAEVSAVNDSLQKEIGELQVSEMEARERSKKFKERIEKLNKLKTEYLLKIENYKLKFTKVSEQHWKINEIDEYMREKDEEVAKLESEIEGMKMHEKAASLKSKSIVDGLNRRLRVKAEQNKKLKVKIKDLKIELLAETSNRKQDRWSNGFQNIGSQTDMTGEELVSSIRLDEWSYGNGYTCTTCSVHTKDLEKNEMELLKLKTENQILTKKIPQLEAINKSCLSLAERALEKSEKGIEEKMKMRETFASLTRKTNGDFESADGREGARVTLCTTVSQTAEVSRDLNDFGTLVRERVYQEKMEMRRFVDDMDIYEKRLEFERMQKTQMEAEKLFRAEREKAEKSLRAEREKAEKLFRAEREKVEKSYKAERQNFLYTEKKLRKVEADLESVQNQLSATTAKYNALKKSKNRAKQRIRELERLQIEEFTMASRKKVSKVVHISTQTEMPAFTEASVETERGSQTRRQLRFSDETSRYEDAYKKKVERYPSHDEIVKEEEEVVQQQTRAKQTFYRLNLLNKADSEISLGEYVPESSKKKRSFFKWIREKMASKRKRRKCNKMLQRSRIAMSDNESAKRPSSKGSFFSGRSKKKKSSKKESKKSKRKEARTVEEDANNNVRNLPLLDDQAKRRSPTHPAVCGLVNTHNPNNDSGLALKMETSNRDKEDQAGEDAPNEFAVHMSRAPLVVREATKISSQEQKAQGSMSPIAIETDTVKGHRGTAPVNNKSRQGKDVREPHSIIQEPPTSKNDVANSRTFNQKTSNSPESNKDTSTSQKSSVMNQNAEIILQDSTSVCHPPIILVKESCDQVDVQNRSESVKTNVVHVKSSQALESNENQIELKPEGMEREVEQPDVQDKNHVGSGRTEATNENRTVSKEAEDGRNDSRETDNDVGNKIESGGDEGNSDNSGDDDKGNDTGGAQNGKKKKGRFSIIWKGFRSKKGKKTSTDNEASDENGNNEKKDKKYEKKLKKRLKKEKKKQKNAEKKKKKKEKEKKKKKDSKVKDKGKEDKPADGQEVSKQKQKESKKQKSDKKKSNKETSSKKDKKAEGKKNKEAKSEKKKAKSEKKKAKSEKKKAKSEKKKAISEKKKAISEKKKATKIKEKKAKITKEWLRLEKKKAKLDKVKTRSSKEKEDLRRKKRIVHLKKMQLENKWSEVERDEKEMIEASKQEKEATQNEPGTSGTDGRLFADEVDVQNLAKVIEPVDTGNEPSSTPNSSPSAAGHKKRRRISINFKKFFSGKKSKSDVKHESDLNQINQTDVENAQAAEGEKSEGETVQAKDGEKSGEINRASFRNHVVEPEEDFDVLPEIIIHQPEVDVDNRVQDSINTTGSAKEMGSGERQENEGLDDNIQLIESTYESNEALAKSDSKTSVILADQVQPFHGWDSSSNDSRASLTIIKKIKSLPNQGEKSPGDLECKNVISALITPGDSVKIHHKGEAIEIDTGEEEYDRAKAAAKAICEEDSNDESDDEFSICIPDGSTRTVNVRPEEPKVCKNIHSEDRPRNDKVEAAAKAFCKTSDKDESDDEFSICIPDGSARRINVLPKESRDGKNIHSEDKPTNNKVEAKATAFCKEDSNDESDDEFSICIPDGSARRINVLPKESRDGKNIHSEDKPTNNKVEAKATAFCKEDSNDESDDEFSICIPDGSTRRINVLPEQPRIGTSTHPEDIPKNDKAKAKATAFCKEDSNDESDDEFSICIPDGSTRRINVLPEQPRVGTSTHSEDKPKNDKAKAKATAFCKEDSNDESDDEFSICIPDGSTRRINVLPEQQRVGTSTHSEDKPKNDKAKAKAKAFCKEDSNDESDDEFSICIPDGSTRRINVLPEEPRVGRSTNSEDKPKNDKTKAKATAFCKEDGNDESDDELSICIPNESTRTVNVLPEQQRVGTSTHSEDKPKNDKAKAKAKAFCKKSDKDESDDELSICIPDESTRTVNVLPEQPRIGKSIHSDRQQDAAKQKEVKNDMYDSWSDEERMMDQILQGYAPKDQPSIYMTQKKSWQQQDEDERLMDEILGVDTTTSVKKNAATRQAVDFKNGTFASWSDEEKMMDEILQEHVENDQLLKNMAQNKTWQQRDEDERLMDEILGVDTMKNPEKSKQLKRVSFCESTPEVFVDGIESCKQSEAMKANTHQTKAFNHLDKENEKKTAVPEKGEQHHVSAIKSSMKANSAKQEEGQNADSNDGAKYIGKSEENILASFRNYAAETKIDVQPPINIRKSEEEIAFERDVENLFTKEDEDNLFLDEDVHNLLTEEDVNNLLPEQDVDNLSTKEDEDNLFLDDDVDNLLPEQQVTQESPVPLISKAKNEKDPFSRTALMGKGYFIYRGRRKEQEILREIKQVDTIKKEDKKLKREAKKAAAKMFTSVARPVEHSFVISPAEHTIRVTPAFGRYSALPAIPRQPK